MKSSRPYSLVTKHWPRIAAGMVVMIGLAELVVGGLTADSGIEFYLMTWAATTGGLWFLFEKAEKSLGAKGREATTRWFRQARWGEALRSTPAHFASLFDHLFGERHLSLRCFGASAVASGVSVGIVLALWLALAWPMEMITYSVTDEVHLLVYQVSLPDLLLDGATLLTLALLLNLAPDFVSLLQTRWLLGRMAKTGRTARLLLADLALTAGISATAVLAITQSALPQLAPGPFGGSDPSVWGTVTDVASFAPRAGRRELPVLPVNVSANPVDPDTVGAEIEAFIADVRQSDEDMAELGELVALDTNRALPMSFAWFRADMPQRWYEAFRRIWDEDIDTRDDGRLQVIVGLPVAVFFYSAFFTSVWLWLYAASVLVSRLLVRMNDGVGFLLRVTDVDRQPFRSMGFVSVLIVSALFAMGLPFVLI